MNEARDVDVVGLPYAERQTIIVVPDAEADSIRATLEDVRSNGSRARVELERRLEDNPLVGLTLATAVRQGWLPQPHATLVQQVLPYVPVIAERFAAQRRIFEAWRRTKVATRLVSASEAAKLRWPKGDPVRDGIYVGSPADPHTYYPLATFHDDVFLERAEELQRLLARLGATRINVTHVSVESARRRGRLSAAVPSGRLSARAKRDSDENVLEIFEATLAAAAPLPREKLETDLHWLTRERRWQGLVEQRYADQLRMTKLVFVADSNYGLGAEVESAVGKLPADVGAHGSFKTFRGRRVDLEVHFEPFDRDA